MKTLKAEIEELRELIAVEENGNVIHYLTELLQQKEHIERVFEADRKRQEAK